MVLELKFIICFSEKTTSPWFVLNHILICLSCLFSIYKNLGANESACLNSVDCNLGVSQKRPKSMTLCFGYNIQFLSNFGLYKHRKRQND